MKTWKVVKELSEGSEKQFISGPSRLGSYTKANLAGNDLIHFKKYSKDHERIETVYMHNEEWEEVKEFTNWDKAREHMEKGKRATETGATYIINDFGRLMCKHGCRYMEEPLSLRLLDSNQWGLS